LVPTVPESAYTGRYRLPTDPDTHQAVAARAHDKHAQTQFQPL
jgi:hypothetical protein